MKTRTKAGITGVALATAATMMVTAPSASGDHESSSSAYGFSIGGSPGEPAVEYKGGETKTDGGKLPAELGPLAAGGLLTVMAGDDQASATIANLKIGNGLADFPAELRKELQKLQQVCAELPEDEAPVDDLLGQIPGGLKDVIGTPESLKAACDALGGGDFTNALAAEALSAECNGDDGTVEILNARAFNSDTALNDSDVDPNTSLLPKELAPLIKITLNRQSKPQGPGSLKVDALVLELGGEEVAVLASATCGDPIAHAPKPQEPNQPAPAPAPVPVEQSVPVTG